MRAEKTSGEGGLCQALKHRKGRQRCWGAENSWGPQAAWEAEGVDSQWEPFVAWLGMVTPRKEGDKSPRRDLEGNEEREGAVMGPPG